MSYKVYKGDIKFKIEQTKNKGHRMTKKLVFEKNRKWKLI